jgi:hypothetical protein
MEKYKVLLGVPSNGHISEGSSRASWLCSLHHTVMRHASANPSGPNFNPLWCDALNAAREGKVTHFAMIHADLTVHEDEEGKRWIDRLIEEMEEHDLDFVSCPNAIKDARGLTSSGIGNPDNPWNPWRRFTVAELAAFPKTFTIGDTEHPDKFLLHNHALCVWDLRNPDWQIVQPDGTQLVLFNFPEKIEWDEAQKKWVRWQESDDWYFSRRLWQGGFRTAITKRIKLGHHGGMEYENWGEWGCFRDGDEDTAPQWRADPKRVVTHSDTAAGAVLEAVEDFEPAPA